MDSFLLWRLFINYKGENDMDAILNSFWKFKEEHHDYMDTYTPSEKSEKRAEELRLEGNLYYKSRDFEQALTLYNLSIMFSPHPVMDNEDMSVCTKLNEDDDFDFPRINPAKYGGILQGESTSLAKAFSNRSALLFELGFYKKCLNDIDLAKEYGIPKELLSKLEGRRDRCQEVMTRSRSSDEWQTGQEAKKDLDAKWDEGRKSVSKNIEEQLPNCQDLKTLSLEERISFQAKHLPKLQNPNPYIPSLSSAVKVINTHYAGRGVTAVTDILPGEVLGSERAYIIEIDDSKLTIFCSTCSTLCLTPLPCPGCTMVIYCSRSCRTRGLAEDHWYDCKMLPSLVALGLGQWSGSYKLFKTFSFHQMKSMSKELLKQKDDNPNILGFNKKGIYNSTSYETIYHLCRNEPKDDKLLVRKGAISVIIANLLEKCGRFFVNERGEPVTVTKEDFLDTCKALLFNKLLAGNAFSSSPERIGSTEVQVKEQGFMLCPALSLVNHSCSPSAHWTHNGRQMVLIALRPIGAGEEITIAYKLSFYFKEISFRKEDLKHFNIECKCEACEGHWPTFSELREIKSFSVKCLNCFAEANSQVMICSKCMCMLSKDAELPEHKLIQAKMMKWHQMVENMRLIWEKVYKGEPLTKQDTCFIPDASVMAHNYCVMPSPLCVLLKYFVEISAEDGCLWVSYDEEHQFI